MFEQLFGNPVIVIGLIVLVVVVIGSIVNAIVKMIGSAANKASMGVLIRTAADGNEDKVLSLISEGANVNEKSRLGDTALILAAKNNHSNLVKLLVKNGAEINLLGSEQKSVLIYAIEASDNEIIQYLVKSGADLNLGNPLAFAVCQGEIDIICTLLNHGAKPEGTEMKYAAHQGNVEIMKILLSHGAKPEGILDAAGQNHLEAVKCLVEAGADVNTNVDRACDFSNLPPLHFAIENKNVNMIRFLIENGADVNGKYIVITNQGLGFPVTPWETARRTNKEIKTLIKDAGGK